MKRSFILGLALGATMAGATFAQDGYPARDIELVVPFAPGGAVDVTSRLIAETANTMLEGGALVVANRSGGAGIVGQSFVAKSEPDGYTLLAMTSSVVTNPQLKGAPYKVTDFIPVAAYNLDPEVLVVPPNSPFETAEDFITAAKEGPLNMDISGIATSHHMAAIAVANGIGVEFTYLPAKGLGEQLQAVTGGHVDGGMWSMGEAKSHIQSGAMKVLAVASDRRDPDFPDVPTFDEAGLGVPIWATFRGWGLPAGTPEPIVTFLSDLLGEVVATQAFQEKMKAGGYIPVYRSSEEFQMVISSYSEMASRIIEENGLAQ